MRLATAFYYAGFPVYVVLIHGYDEISMGWYIVLVVPSAHEMSGIRGTYLHGYVSHPFIDVTHPFIDVTNPRGCNANISHLRTFPYVILFTLRWLGEAASLGLLTSVALRRVYVVWVCNAEF